MRNKHMAAAALIIAASLTSQARAAVFGFDFRGAGVSGSIQLTYGPNPNTGVLPGTSPNPVDPVGSFVVTGITGTFSDSVLGISNASITGLVPRNPAHPGPLNLLAPNSFGFYLITHGVPFTGGIAPGLSYDDLFYPGGSPQTASDYPFHGGFLDIYGVVFTIAGGYAVNFWSDGDFGAGATYGAAVTNGTDLLHYADPGVSVPEPSSLWLLGNSLLGLLAWRRRSSVAGLVAPARG